MTVSAFVNHEYVIILLMKLFFILISGFFCGIALVFLLYPLFLHKQPAVSVDSPPAIIEKPLEKYAIDALSQRQFSPSDIRIGNTLAESTDSTSFMFYFSDSGKKVSGVLTAPNEPGDYPVIIMIRGFAAQERYTPGYGTQRVAEHLAANGFMTLAPDFLGYGESDTTSENIFERRFQTYTTTLTLLASLNEVNDALDDQSINARLLPDQVGIWGHSNGGQITLTVLEVTQKAYPTVLWAPVSKPFPYSILYYTDGYEDYGKGLRRDLAAFEKDYDVESFNPAGYLERIQAPLQIFQGDMDTEVPLAWSDELVDKLKKLEKEVDYFTYAGADHSLVPTGWNDAVVKLAEFYRTQLSTGR